MTATMFKQVLLFLNQFECELVTSQIMRVAFSLISSPLFQCRFFQVVSVEQVIDKSDEVAELEFLKLEEKLGEKPSSKE